ncbi:fatty acid activator protein [Rutstroemia sp. NJR-2017a BBW]|nr:fatty acid activator protein [Rutstroemia sp. NJR-2017a BBW]
MLTIPRRSFRNLPPRTRGIVGLSFFAWGTIGLFLSDTAEEKLGFKPGGERDPEVASKDGGFRIRVVEK